jgi:hypothetical protein
MQTLGDTVTLKLQYYLTNRYAVYTFVPWQQTLIAATFSLARPRLDDPALATSEADAWLCTG